MIKVVGTWENTAAAETGIKEIDQRIVVVIARNNQNLKFEGTKILKYFKEIVIQQ